MSMIAFGIFFASLSLYSWWTILSHLKFDAVGFSIVVIWTLLSVFLIFFGIKRYRHWLQNQGRLNKDLVIHNILNATF